jgi:carbon storage regulator
MVAKDARSGRIDGAQSFMRGRVLATDTGNTWGVQRAMLVLSRKKNESIVIDEHIVITIVEIRGDKVRLGIEAPKEIPIHRSEVHAAIHAEHKSGEQDPPKVAAEG